MKTRKIIGGVLGCLMLCGLLVGCSGNNSNSNSNYQKGTVTESGFTSEWMGIQYTLPNDMTMLSQETLDSGSKDNIQMEMQAYKKDDTTENIGMLTEDISKDTSMDEEGYVAAAKTQMEKPYRVSPLMKRATEPLQDKNFTSCHIAIQRMSMELKQQLHKPFYAKRKKIE